MKLLLTFANILALVVLSSCQLFADRPDAPVEVKDAMLDAKINPKNQEISVLETSPLMNNAVLELYQQAQFAYDNNDFNQAVALLQRAYEIQPNAAQVAQLMAEIYLHKGDYEQAHYWSVLATANAPAKGKACEKSWRILALAAENLGYRTELALALENQDECIVKQTPRY